MVIKLEEADFVKEVKYTTWLENVAMVKKPSDRWRICTYFIDLSKECPKDVYMLLKIYRLVDETSSYQVLKFIDAYYGYN